MIIFSYYSGLPDGTNYSRSVISEPLRYNPNGDILNIPTTAKGTTIAE